MPVAKITFYYHNDESIPQIRCTLIQGDVVGKSCKGVSFGSEAGLAILSVDQRHHGK